MLEQDFEQRNLHARIGRVTARRRQAKRRRAEAFGIKLPHRAVIKVRVHLRAGFEQNFRGLHDVLRRLLAVVFNGICANVMQERRAVFARRTCSNELRPFAKQPRRFRWALRSFRSWLGLDESQNVAVQVADVELGAVWHVAQGNNESDASSGKTVE